MECSIAQVRSFIMIIPAYSYTNKALARFNSSVVLPAEFASFNIVVILSSAMLYGVLVRLWH